MLGLILNLTYICNVSLRDIDICEGKIKFVMPFTEERLVLDIEDLEKIKAMILE